jgi:hypothetical protein
MAAIMSRSAVLRLAGANSRPGTTMRAATGVVAIRRLQSTFASTSYDNILVDVVGTNKDVAFITLNRPKAVCSPTQRNACLGT